MSNKFPFLTEDDYYRFPPPEEATPEGIVAVGGNLSPGMLLSAYQQGVFPWYSKGEPIVWWNPDPRFILYPAKLKVSQSMYKILKQNCFSIVLDKDFQQVIKNCQTIRRKGQPGTWITAEMLKAYCELHTLGYAHSIEVREGETLIGGLYGISLGKCFFGESMFSHQANASKAALITLAWTLFDAGFHFIDCQVHTDHLESLGAESISRHDFMLRLAEALKAETFKGNWSEIFPHFPFSSQYPCKPNL
jgi:leucyl/phenylalanyl-tRNA--protein transferase